MTINIYYICIVYIHYTSVYITVGVVETKIGTKLGGSF